MTRLESPWISGVSCDLYRDDDYKGIFILKTFAEVFNRSGTGCFIQTASFDKADLVNQMKVRITAQRDSYDSITTSKGSRTKES
jgi:hypothetical protein